MSRQQSLEKRHSAATTQASVAVLAFVDAADSLDGAAVELDAVAAEAHAVANDHRGRARAATADAEISRARAQKIRDLLS